jgi:hypothetical protein
VPKTIETTVYTFDELSEGAKESAREWARSLPDLFCWSDDYIQSIEAFCAEFGVKLKDWQIGPWSPFWYKTDAENSHFRGRKLSEFKRDLMPTGFCGDCALWSTFYDVFKKTGSAKKAFDDALYAGFEDWRSDLESTYEDDQIDDFLIANEYEFTEDGNRF